MVSAVISLWAFGSCILNASISHRYCCGVICIPSASVFSHRISIFPVVCIAEGIHCLPCTVLLFYLSSSLIDTDRLYRFYLDSLKLSAFFNTPLCLTATLFYRILQLHDIADERYHAKFFTPI